MNITTLNTTTLDGNVIIKKGGGGTPTPPSGGDGWEYYKVDSSFNDLSSEEIRNISTALENAYGLKLLYYIGTITGGVLVPALTVSDGAETMGIKCKGDGMYYDRYSKEGGVTSFKDLAKEPFLSAFELTAALPFLNALTPCTKEEFEALITM